MRTRAVRSIAILSALLLLLGCGPQLHVIDAPSDYVTFSVQATDGFGRPIQGVQVRIVEAWQERDLDYYPARGPYRQRSTGTRGRVTFDAYDLGQSGLGFLTTLDGDAVLYDIASEDEAVVTLEIGNSLLGWIEVDVPLSYARPYNEIFIEY